MNNIEHFGKPYSCKNGIKKKGLINIFQTKKNN